MTAVQPVVMVCETHEVSSTERSCWAAGIGPDRCVWRAGTIWGRPGAKVTDGWRQAQADSVAWRRAREERQAV